MIQALAYLDNSYALKTHYSIGFDKLADIATRVGIETNISTSNPSAALGTTEITLLELVTGYSTFANGGDRVQPRFITKIETMSGKIIYENPVVKEADVLDENLTFIMTDFKTSRSDVK